MKSLGTTYSALEKELLEPEEDDFASFESQSLIRELKKSVFRGDDEITLILAQAFCRKHLRRQPSQEAVIYCRVSSEQQALGGGLQRQIYTCCNYARALDYSLVGVYCEVASGAGQLPTRALVERIATKRGCLILCEDHSRWSRNGAEDVPPMHVKMCSAIEERFGDSVKELLVQYKTSILENQGKPN